MPVELVPIVEVDTESLISFLTSDTWPFHANSALERNTVESWIADGRFESEEVRTYWIMKTDVGRVGLVRAYDLEDDTAMFDIRILTAHRAQGLGTAAVARLVRQMFRMVPEMQRIGAETRDDNVGMTRVLRRCGFAKEAHYRRGWITQDGEVHDSVGYGLLRDDWLSGTVSPVKWDDEPK